MARGGRGGGSRGPRGEVPRSVQVSKKLSWLLRHGAESENLTLGPGGFANLADVLNNRKLRGMQITFDEVRQVVDDNEKQRFTMIPVDVDTEEIGQANGSGAAQQQPSTTSTDLKDWKIRANQGHSIKVEDEGLLEPITADKAPDSAVHGTNHRAWMLIVESGGLKKMNRNHIHFAPGLPAGFKSVIDVGSEDVKAPVISGMRSDSTILIFVDVKKAMEAGIKFWKSDNGVILTEGNEYGLLPLEFFRRVEDRTGEGVLVEDGRVVKEAPQRWIKGKGIGKG
jgi:2'-phosphotransferase